MGRAESAGEEPAPTHRWVVNIQDFVQDTFNLFNVLLDTQWHIALSKS